MSSHALVLLGVFLAVLLATVKPMGCYLAKVIEGRFAPASCWRALCSGAICSRRVAKRC